MSCDATDVHDITDTNVLFRFYLIPAKFSSSKSLCKWIDQSLNKSPGWFFNFQGLFWFSLEINIFIPVNATLGCKQRIPYLVIFLCFFLVSRVWDILQALTLKKTNWFFLLTKRNPFMFMQNQKSPKAIDYCTNIQHILGASFVSGPGMFRISAGVWTATDLRSPPAGSHGKVSLTRKLSKQFYHLWKFWHQYLCNIVSVLMIRIVFSHFG